MVFCGGYTMKIKVVGQVTGFSGFSMHLKGLCMALHKMNIDFSIESNINPQEIQTIPNELIPYLNKSMFVPDVILLITVSDVWPYYFIDKKSLIVGVGIFEGDRLSYNWEKRASDPKLDLIIVPSEHTKKAFEVTNKPITIIPHGFNPEIFNPNVPKIPNFDNGKFKFLYVGGWADGIRDRRGLDIAVRAFTSEFTLEEQKNIQFIMKINTAYQSLETVINNIKGLNLPEHLEMPILFDNYDDKTMASLYRTCDALVIPSKAEAFCLPILESLACGTPVITTNYGGQLDFVNKENGWLIDVESFEKATGNQYYERAKWAKPSQASLQKLMRTAYNEKKKNQVHESVQHLTWENSAKKLVGVLNEYLGKN